MTALDTLQNIIGSKLIDYDFKYCLVDTMKRPFTIQHTMASVKHVTDFVDIHNLLTCDDLERYAGIGISVQASKVCAVDLDKCVAKPFDVTSINQQALDIIELFKEFAYVEFSFSGTGIRILFTQPTIDDYVAKYKIKNSKLHMEYYEPSHSNRYVTITGRYLYNNNINTKKDYSDVILVFLDKYMRRQSTYTKHNLVDDIEDERSFDELMKIVKFHLFKKYDFQDLWFHAAPGSGKDESERDYWLIKYLYLNITKDRDKLKQIFEESHFFKTKDKDHMFKWTRNEYRYYNLVFDRVKEMF